MKQENKAERSRLKRMARDFLTVNRAASLATSDVEGTPHVSVVYCVIGDDLKLYFSTRVQGRKYINLSARPDVAMAFYDEPRLQMIQLSGRAERVENLQREQEIMAQLIRLRYGDPNWPLPTMQLFDRGATNEIAIIEVVPYEMTFADFSTPKAGRYKDLFRKVI